MNTWRERERERESRFDLEFCVLRNFQPQLSIFPLHIVLDFYSP